MLIVDTTMAYLALVPPEEEKEIPTFASLPVDVLRQIDVTNWKLKFNRTVRKLKSKGVYFRKKLKENIEITGRSLGTAYMVRDALYSRVYGLRYDYEKRCEYVGEVWSWLGGRAGDPNRRQHPHKVDHFLD